MSVIRGGIYMRVKCISSDRDMILRVMKRELGAEAVYRPLPFFSYNVGGLTLTRDGFIETGDGTANCDEPAGYVDTEYSAASDSTSDMDGYYRDNRIRKTIAVLASLGLCELPELYSDNGIGAGLCGSVLPGDENETQDCMESRITRNEQKNDSVAYPMDEHTGQTLMNLLFIISARYELINCALDMRRSFYVERSLVESMLMHPPVSKWDFLHILYDREDEYRGIDFSAEQILFSGFRKGRPEEAYIHRQLADLIMHAAVSRKWVKPLTRRTRNRKYSFRTWLNSIGMTGPEYEEARAVMLSRLPGRSDRRRIKTGECKTLTS